MIAERVSDLWALGLDSVGPSAGRSLSLYVRSHAQNVSTAVQYVSSHVPFSLWLHVIQRVQIRYMNKFATRNLHCMWEETEVVCVDAQRSCWISGFVVFCYIFFHQSYVTRLKCKLIMLIDVVLCDSGFKSTSVSVYVTQKWLADWLIENNPNKAKLHDWMGSTIIPPS